MELKSLSRGLRLLELLSRDSGSRAVTDLARDMEVDKSTISRLLKTLRRHGFVEQDQTTRGYALGPGVVPLGQRALRRLDIRAAAKPFLRRLATETDECAHLAILYSRTVLYVDQATSDRTVNVDAPLGTMAPLHCTALGKAVLAAQSPEWQRTFVEEEGLRSYTRRTITEGAQLLRHLQQVRDSGIAVDDEEFSVGIRCLAAPVFDHSGVTAAAIGISGPSPRVTDDRMTGWSDIVKNVAAELSARMGYRAESEADIEPAGRA